MSRGSEDNFDLGMKINADSVRELLQASRRYGVKLGPPIAPNYPIFTDIFPDTALGPRSKI
ncbi:hypothetical protein GYMLUDRAFT_242742 [Collybiopsis luxurians FD-317 M1]|uniref:Uncharacterized protein n=1 Tax=Collybiopsis luxurians FD-317 M1 TaxID=944289 RepID=A0A0D0C3B2_9AGAR|nr:hypothetical protein GYMLUDRAFT_242742 [Collybiopsis luxurians FD-317 M1]